MHYTDRMKNKNHMIISKMQKAFDKIQHSFVIKKKKSLHKLDTERVHPDIIKATCNKSMTKIILNSEKLKAFPLRSGRR